MNILSGLNSGYSNIYNGKTGKNNGRSTDKVFEVHKMIGDEIQGYLGSSYYTSGFGRTCLNCHLCSCSKQFKCGGKNHDWKKNPAICSVCNVCKKCLLCSCKKVKIIGGNNYIQGKETTITAGWKNKMNVDMAVFETISGIPNLKGVGSFKWPMKDLDKNANNLLENTTGQARNVKVAGYVYGIFIVFFDKTKTVLQNGSTIYDEIADKHIEPYIEMLNYGDLDFLGIDIISDLNGQIVPANIVSLSHLSKPVQDFLLVNNINKAIMEFAKKC